MLISLYFEAVNRRRGTLASASVRDAAIAILHEVESFTLSHDELTGIETWSDSRHLCSAFLAELGIWRVGGAAVGAGVG